MRGRLTLLRRRRTPLGFTPQAAHLTKGYVQDFYITHPDESRQNICPNFPFVFTFRSSKILNLLRTNDDNVSPIL